MSHPSQPGRRAGDDARVAAERLRAVRAVFPSRALKVFPPTPGLRGLLSYLWGPLIGLVGVVSMAVSYFPLLVTDLPLALSGKAVPMQEHYLGPHSRCHYWAVIVTVCDLELRTRAPDGLWQSRNVSYAHFFGRPDALADMRILGLPAEPYWLTVDMALDRVANRVITAVFFIGGGVAFVIWFMRGAMAAWRIPRRMRAALSGQMLTPVSLSVFTGPRARRGLRRDDTGTEILYTNPRGDALFPLASSMRAPPGVVLGVTVPGSAFVMPLDRALAWVELTDEERRRILAAARVVTGG